MKIASKRIPLKLRCTRSSASPARFGWKSPEDPKGSWLPLLFGVTVAFVSLSLATIYCRGTFKVLLLLYFLSESI